VLCDWPALDGSQYAEIIAVAQNLATETAGYPA
jgi:hypothetical protein